MLSVSSNRRSNTGRGFQSEGGLIFRSRMSKRVDKQSLVLLSQDHLPVTLSASRAVQHWIEKQFSGHEVRLPEGPKSNQIYCTELYFAAFFSQMSQGREEDSGVIKAEGQTHTQISVTGSPDDSCRCLVS